MVDTAIAALRAQLPAAAPESPLKRQRKQITILFVDVVGSTHMAEDLDPEMVLEIMDGALRSFGEIVEKNLGLVARLMGDGLLAFFGAPQAREDDPVRAVRAGLEIAQAAQAYAGRVAERWGIDGFFVRVGIHTGAVALGEVGGPAGSEYTAMGDAINLASRLEKAAPPQGILISSSTFRHIEGRFEIEPRGQIQVAGREAPVGVFLVLGARARAFRKSWRGVEGIETRMIGRENEMRALQEGYRLSQDEQRLAALTLIGEAGVGKSRLSYEFERWLVETAAEYRFFQGRAGSTTLRQPFGLLRDIIASHFQLHFDDPPETVREKLTGGLAAVLGDGEAGQLRAHVIGQFLGYDFSDSPFLRGFLDDARQLRDRGLAFLQEFFQSMVRERPTVIFLEDLHLADESSLDALIQLLQGLAGEPLFVVSSARPEFRQRSPRWDEEIPGHRALQLEPLTRQDSRILVREILRQVSELPDTLSDLVVRHAEGNPFFLEELIKMLIEDGVIVKEESRWRVAVSQMTTVRVPQTLTGVLQARMDGLPLLERQTLQEASVVGQRFWDGTLAYINDPREPGEHAAGIHRALQGLQVREIVYNRENSTFTSVREFQFKHANLREVAYESVPFRVRQTYHRMVADWLIEHSGSRVNEFAGSIADHLERAGDIDGAVEYLQRAGLRAAGQYANAEAIDYLSHALELIPETDLERRFELLLQRERVYDHFGERERQKQDLSSLRQIAEAMEDLCRQGEIALREANYARETVDFAGSIQAASRAIVLGQNCQIPAIEAEGHLISGRALLRQGLYDEAQQRLESGLSISRSHQLLQLWGDSLRAMGAIHYFQGDLPKTRSYFEQALAIYRDERVRDRSGEASTLNNLGSTAADAGDFAGARAFYEEALLVSLEIGDRESETLVLGNLGSIAHDNGDYLGAIPYLERSVEIAHLIGERHYQANGYGNLGFAYIDLGDLEKAAELTRRALDIYREINDQRGESYALALMGLLASRSGDQETAQFYAESALNIAEEIGSPQNIAQSLTLLAHAQLELGQYETAARTFERATRQYDDLHEQPHAHEPRAGLAMAFLKLGETDRAGAMVEQIAGRLEANPFIVSNIECQVYFTCYRVQAALGDPNAGGFLRMAYDRLHELASRLPDEVQRARFFENNPVHGQILAAWKTANPA